MRRISVLIYQFFKQFPAVFYSLLLATMILFGYLASKIEFVEDISALLPEVGEDGAEKLAFSELRVKDKVYLQFTSSADTIGPAELIEACDLFTAALQHQDSTQQLIGSVFTGVDRSEMQGAIGFLYQNAPVFLSEEHLEQLDALFEPAALERQMQENYNMLRSVAGRAYRDLITRDPVGMRNIFLAGGVGGMGGNFTMYNNHLFTPDTTVALAFLAPQFKSLDSKAATRLNNLIEREIKVFTQQHPDIEILFHGAPIQSVSNSSRIKSDLALTVSISLVIIFVLLMVTFKTKRTLFYLMAPVFYGVLFSLAMVYLIKGTMSLMVLGIGAIVMGVAFSYCLHMICHHKYVDDPVKIIEDQAVPLFIAALTTIGAFAGLLLTESEMLHDFGLFASFGILGTLIFALWFLPQFFRPGKSRRSEKAFDLIEKINSYRYDRQKWLVGGIVLVSIVCYFTSKNVEFDSNLRNLGYDNEQLTRSKALYAAKTAGNYDQFHYATVAGDLESTLLASQKLSAGLDELKADGVIGGYTSSLTFFVPESEQRARIDRWNRYWTEEKKAEVKQRIVDAGKKYRLSDSTFAPFFALINKTFEPVSLYEAQVLPEALMSNMIEYTGGRYVMFTPVHVNKNDLWRVGEQLTAKGASFVVLDPMYYASDMVKMIHNDFNTILAISSLFILFVLFVSYRSVVLTLIAFLPMGLSWYIVLGCMAIFGMQFNLINIIISSFIFGIGVDYSIYMMDGLLDKTRGSRYDLLAYHKTAIFFSAVILIIVVCSLLFAVHPAIRSIGVVTLIGMGATILITYSLQPFVYHLLITKRIEKGKRPLVEKWVRLRNKGE